MEEIRNLISRFANSFDRKDWDGLRSILAEQVNCDYTSLRGSKEIVSGDDYVAKRTQALDSIDTHHIISNLEINASENEAICIASTMIWR